MSPAVIIFLISALVLLIFFTRKTILRWMRNTCFPWDPVIRKTYIKCGFSNAEEAINNVGIVIDMQMVHHRQLRPEPETAFKLDEIQNETAVDFAQDKEIRYESFVYNYVAADKRKVKDELFTELFENIKIHCTSFKQHQTYIESNTLPPYLQSLIDFLNSAKKCYINVPYILKMMRGNQIALFDANNSRVNNSYVGVIDVVMLKNSKYFLLNLIILTDQEEFTENHALNTCRRNGFQQSMNLSYVPVIYNVVMKCDDKHFTIKLPVDLL